MELLRLYFVGTCNSPSINLTYPGINTLGRFELQAGLPSISYTAPEKRLIIAGFGSKFDVYYGTEWKRLKLAINV